MLKFLQFITALSIYKWLKPKIKGILILIGCVLITIYLHNEYLNWALITDNLSYVDFSFILKNIILFILIFSYLINLRIQNLKDDKTDKSKMIVGDGFDKFRVKHKLRTKAEQIIENK